MQKYKNWAKVFILDYGYTKKTNQRQITVTTMMNRIFTLHFIFRTSNRAHFEGPRIRARFPGFAGIFRQSPPPPPPPHKVFWNAHGPNTLKPWVYKIHHEFRTGPLTHPFFHELYFNARFVCVSYIQNDYYRKAFLLLLLNLHELKEIPTSFYLTEHNANVFEKLTESPVII